MATLRKGKSDEVVYIDTTIIDDQCQYSVSVSARMPQEDSADKEEISQMETLITDDRPIDVDAGGKGTSCARFIYLVIGFTYLILFSILNSCRRDQYFMQGKE
jgi:hypothetical protein